MTDVARWRMTVKSEWRFVVALLAGAVFLGFVAIVLEPLFFARPMILFALPVLMIGAAMIVVSLEWSFVVLMFVRAGADSLLEGTKVGAQGSGFGVGGLLNLAIVFMALLLLIRRPSLVPKPVYLAWIPFLLVILAGTAHAPEKAAAVRIWLNWLTVASVYWIAVYLVGRGWRPDSLLKVITVGSIFPVLYGIVAAAIRKPAPIEPGADPGDGFRLAGAFTHPNIHAFYLILMIAITLYFWAGDREQKRPFSWAWGGYLVVLLGLLALTKTRSAWGASVVMLLLYGWRFDRRVLWTLLIVTPLAVLGVPEIRDRLLDLAQGNTYVTFAKLNSLAWRKLLWASAFASMHVQDWVWGRGFLSFDYYSVDFFPLAGGIEWGAHNVYVQLASDTGEIGLAAYFWMYLMQLRYVRPLWADQPRLAALIAAIVCSCLVVGYSDNMLRYLVYNWYLWFVIGVITAPSLFAIASRQGMPRQPVGGRPVWR